MNDFPYGFVLILFGFFAFALIFVLAAYILKQRRLNRLKNPYKDYYHNRG